MIRIIFRSLKGSVFQFHEIDGGKVETFFSSNNDYSDDTMDLKDLYDRYMRLKRFGWRVEETNISEDDLFMVSLSYC